MVYLRNKVFIVLFLIAVSILTTGCAKKNQGELLYTTAEDVLIRMENKETFVVYLGTTTCSFCIKYKVELEDVVKNKNVTIYGVMINEGNTANNQILQDRFELSGTPQTYWVVNGVKTDTLVGYVSASEVVAWLDENKIGE